MNQEIVLTHELLENLFTARRGLTSSTIRALNVPRPLKIGWRQRLIGTTCTKEAYERALAGRTKYRSRPKYKQKMSDYF